MADDSDSGNEYDFLPREEPKAEERTPAREEPPTKRPERIEPEQICPHCGFELFSKPRGGRCPECAAPLDLTATDLLQFADADWVRTLSNGVLLFALAIVLDVASVAVGWGGMRASGSLGHLVAGGLGALSIWLATAKEEGLAAIPSPTATPARWATIAVVGLWVVLLITEWAGKMGAAKGTTVVLLSAYAVEAMLIGFHLQKVATRIPSDGLAAQCLNLAWFMPGVCLVLIAVQLFNLAVPQVLILFFCAFPLIGGLLAMVAWTVVALVRLGLELRSAVAAGEDIAIRKAKRLAQKKK